MSPFSLLGVLPLLSVRVFLALVSSALLLPSLWLVPPLSVLDKNRENSDCPLKINEEQKAQGMRVGADVVPSAISLMHWRYVNVNVCISHLFLQKGGFPHCLSSFFLSSSQLVLLPSPLLLYETLSLGLLSCSLLCPPVLQFFATPPGTS